MSADNCGSESNSADSCEEVNIVVSDLHIGEGEKMRVDRDASRGLRRVWHRVLDTVGYKPDESPVLRDNYLEDFRYDEQFRDFLQTILSAHGQTTQIKLRFLGDTFDPLTMTWRGLFRDPPYEHVAQDKLQRIITGHPVFFDAVADFLSQPNTTIDFFVGNHDLFLVWESLQKMLTDRLVGQNADLAKKIRFIDQQKKFRVIERGVLYEHGMNAEAHNRIDPDNVFGRGFMGTQKKRPALNVPLGSKMVVELVNHLKWGNPLIGRVRKEKRIWSYALRHQWLWGVYAGYRLISYFVHALFMSLNLKTILAIVESTTKSNRFDDYPKRLLRENDEVQVVVLGHSHTWRRYSSDHGTYLNTGSWARALKLEEPEFVFSWGRFRSAEFYWRSLTHFFRTGEVKFAWRLTKSVGVLALIGVMIAVVFGAFDSGEWTLWPLNSLTVKILVAIAGLFTVLAGLIRVLSAEPIVKSDTKFTFALICHQTDGNMKADLMQYHPEEKEIREKI